MNAEVTGTLSKIFYQKDDFLVGMIETENETIKIIGSIYGIHTEKK